jgi:hypothetical protein
MKKYQCILKSFKLGKLIDEDVYNIASQTPINDIVFSDLSKRISTRLENLRATGLTEEQELKLHAAYLTCISGTCKPDIFNEFYQIIKKWYEQTKEAKGIGC